MGFISKSLNINSVPTTVYSTTSPTVLVKPCVIINVLLINSSNSLDLKIDIWKENATPGYKCYIAKDLVLLKSPPTPYELPAKSLVLMPGEVIKAQAFDSGGGSLFTGTPSWSTFDWNTFSWDDITTSPGTPGTVDIHLSLLEQ